MATSKKSAKTVAATQTDDIATLSAALMNKLQPKRVTSEAPEKKSVGRPVFDGYLVFGPVSIPVKSYKATEIEKVSFNTVHVCNAKEIGEAIAQGKTPPAPIHNQLKERGYYCPCCEEGKEGVPSTETLKGFKYGDNQFVTVSDEERKSCAVKSNKKLDITEFVKLTDVDPIHFEASEFLVPGDDFKELFGTLRQQLVAKGVVAITRVAQRGREQVALIRPYGTKGMTIHYLYLEHEVRECELWSDATADAETANLAGMLIDRMTSESFDLSEYQDGYTRALKAMVETKVAGGVVELPQKEAEPKADSKNDIMSKLAAALAAPAPVKKSAKAAKQVAAVA